MLSFGLEPGYVLDRMELYEVRALLGNQHMRHKESWEQTRMLAYIVARCTGSKIQEVKDLFSLPWDDDNEGMTNEEADYSQMDRLKTMSEALLQSGALGGQDTSVSGKPLCRQTIR